MNFSRIIGVIVAVIVTIGLGVWLLVKYLFTAAATSGPAKTALVATGVIAGAAALSFDFGDKVNMAKYRQEALTLVANDPQGATKYVDQLIAATDQEIARRDDVAPAANNTQAAAADAIVSTEMSRRQAMRGIAEAIKAEVSLAKKESTPEALIGEFGRILKSYDPMAAERILQFLQADAKDTLTADHARELIKLDLPPSVRGVLAAYIAKNAAPPNSATVDQIHEFYNQLLAYAGDAPSAPEILKSYVDMLAARGHSNEADEVLRTMVATSPDTEVGSMSAMILVSAAPTDSAREQIVADLVERNPGTAVANRLFPIYLKAMWRDKKVDRALAIIDREGSLVKARTRQEMAHALVKLAQKAVSDPTVAMRASSPGDPTLADLCLTIAEDLVAREENATAIDLLFTMLMAQNALPVNLVSGRPISAVADIDAVASTDAVQSKFLADYFIGIGEINAGRIDAANGRFRMLAGQPLIAGLRPYVLYQVCREALNKRDYPLAAQSAEQSLAALPSSIILISLQEEVTKASREADARAQLEQRITELKQSIESEASQDRKIALHFELAQLYLAVKEIDTARATYLAVADQFGDHNKAPFAIAQAISLMRETGASADQVDQLTKRLIERYPHSVEAEQFRAATEK